MLRCRRRRPRQPTASRFCSTTGVAGDRLHRHLGTLETRAEAGALEELRSDDTLVSSELIAVESARTIDCLRLQGSLTTDEAASGRRAINEWLEAIDLILLRPPVLSRASEPLPTSLGTLDALHPATAPIWRDRMGAVSVVATHDAALGLAARAFGFEVRGV